MDDDDSDLTEIFNATSYRSFVNEDILDEKINDLDDGLNQNEFDENEDEEEDFEDI